MPRLIEDDVVVEKRLQDLNGGLSMSNANDMT